MTQKEWLTQREIAEMLGVELDKLYPRVNALKNAGVIKWKQNPDDQRSILIHVSSIEAIKKAMLIS
jgi:DNA-binding MarR family transcriptional regulator